MRRNVGEMINDSIEKLANYNDKAKARMRNLKYREKDIQEGRQLLNKILRSNILEDDFITLEGAQVGTDKLKRLRNELFITSNLVKFLKGDISIELYQQKDKQLSDFED